MLRGLALTVALALVLAAMAALAACQDGNMLATADVAEARPQVLEEALPPRFGRRVTPTASLPKPPLPSVLDRLSLNEAFPAAPSAVAIDPASGDLYVVGGAPRGWLSTVRHDAMAGQVVVGADPRAVAIHPKTGWAYVANHGSGDVSIVDGFQVLATVPVGDAPSDLAIHPGSGYVYASNTRPRGGAYGQPGTVSILSATAAIAEVTVGLAPQQIEVHPTSGLVYVRNHRGTVTVISGTQVLQDVVLPFSAPLSAMSVEPTTGHVYVAGGGFVAAIDGTRLQAALAVDGPPISLLAADPTTGRLYMAQQNQLSMADGGQVVARLVLDHLIEHLACQPETGYCYAAGPRDAGDTRLTVVDGMQVLTSTWAGSYPRALVADPVGERMLLLGDGITAFVGADPVMTVGVPLGISAAVAHGGYTYLLAQSLAWTGSQILVLRGGQQIAHLSSGGFLASMAANPATGRAYAVDSSEPAVVVISGTEVVERLPVGEGPRAIAANPETGLVYVVNAAGPGPGTGAVDILGDSGWLARVPVGEYPGEVVTDSQTGYIYVANRGLPPEYQGSVDVLSGTQHVTRLPAGRYPHALVVDPATGLLYVPNRESDEVLVYDGWAQLGVVALSGSPLDACPSPLGEGVYVLQEGGRVSVIRGVQQLAELAVATGARAIAADPLGGYVYVLGGQTATGDSQLSVLHGTEVLTTMAFANSVLSTIVVEPDLGYAMLFEDLQDEVIVVGPPR
jgi:YVTN family beta-propeller protein